MLVELPCLLSSRRFHCSPSLLFVLSALLYCAPVSRLFFNSSVQGHLAQRQDPLPSMAAVQALRSKSTVLAAIAVAGAGTYAIRTYLSPPLHADSLVAPKNFKGGIGFTSLRLHSIEPVNHNVKRLRFELPEQNAVSGISLTCMCSQFGERMPFFLTCHSIPPNIFLASRKLASGIETLHTSQRFGLASPTNRSHHRRIQHTNRP